MDDKTKIGLGILEAALIIGTLGDALLRATPWGLNAPLMVGALLISLVLLAGRTKKVDVLAGNGRWFVGAAIFFAFALVWRDSSVLKTLDAFAILFTLSLLGLHIRGHRVELSGITEYAFGAATAAFNALFLPFQLVSSDIGWKTIPHKTFLKRGAAVLRGLIIAVPLLLIFGALFVAADSMFERWVNSIQLRLDLVFGHFVLALSVAWMAAGFLRGVLFSEKLSMAGAAMSDIFTPTASTNVTSQDSPVVTPAATEGAGSIKLGATEVAVVLGLLNFLFLAFVLVQARYFFGGAVVVQATTGLTYADYARRGFFELVTVSVLVLPLLLLGHWMLQKGSASADKIFRRLSFSLIALLYVIMASALLRMLIYEREYGLTELRLYTSAFMGWLALVFVWFSVTVLRGNRERFAWGTLAAGLIVMSTLHVLNPDSFIVRTNIKHAAEAGRSFDACYNTSLSADAVPDLVAAMPAMSSSTRSAVSYRLLGHWSPEGRADWRTWNFSRWVARKAVRERNALFWQDALSRDGRGEKCGISSGDGSQPIEATRIAIDE